MQNELTPQETIIELNRCKVNGYMPTDWDRRCRAIEAAKAALEKQDKMKAVSIFNDVVFECPVCNTLILESDKYCRECGQALD